MVFVDHTDDRFGELQNGLMVCTMSESSDAVTLIKVRCFCLIGHDPADGILLQCLDETFSGPP